MPAHRGAARRGVGWLVAGGVALAACLGAVLDYAALKRHVEAGPHMFPGANCAGAQAGGQTARPTDPSIGLGEWATFQSDPTHNLAIAASAADGQAYAASWSFKTNGTVATPPAVVGGVAYLGSMDGCVYALDATTGALIWAFPAGNQVMGQPLVADGKVLFGTGNKGMGIVQSVGLVRGTGESALYALDAATGKQVWMTPTVGGNMPTPVYQDGVLYDVGGGKTFYAVDAETGAVLWQLPVPSYVSMSSPTLVGDIAVFGGALPYTVTGVDITKHELAWTVPLSGAYTGVDDVSAASAGGVVYVQVPEGKGIKRVVEMAIRATDGKILWQTTLGTDPFNVLQRALGQGDLSAHDGEETGVATVAGGVVYVGNPALHGLWALDATTGAPIWRRPAPIGQGVRTSPVVAGDRIYTSSDTRLFVVDTATGDVVGSTALGTFQERSGILIPCTLAGPLLIGDSVIVGTGDDADTISAIPLEQIA